MLLARPLDVLGLSFALMFPVSLLSGILFTFLGPQLHRDLARANRSWLPNDAGARHFWKWLEETFAIERPRS